MQKMAQSLRPLGRRAELCTTGTPNTSAPVQSYGAAWASSRLTTNLSFPLQASALLLPQGLEPNFCEGISERAHSLFHRGLISMS